SPTGRASMACQCPPALHHHRSRWPTIRACPSPRHRETEPMADTSTATQGSAHDREIVAAKVIITSPGRNFVTLKITTRSGVTGLGDATLNGRELAVASYLQDHVVPNLIGRDAGRIEDLWQFL